MSSSTAQVFTQDEIRAKCRLTWGAMWWKVAKQHKFARKAWALKALKGTKVKALAPKKPTPAPRSAKSLAKVAPPPPAWSDIAERAWDEADARVTQRMKEEVALRKCQDEVQRRLLPFRPVPAPRKTPYHFVSYEFRD